MYASQEGGMVIYGLSGSRAQRMLVSTCQVRGSGRKYGLPTVVHLQQRPGAAFGCQAAAIQRCHPALFSERRPRIRVARKAKSHATLSLFLLQRLVAAAAWKRPSSSLPRASVWKKNLRCGEWENPAEKCSLSTDSPGERDLRIRPPPLSLLPSAQVSIFRRIFRPPSPTIPRSLRQCMLWASRSPPRAAPTTSPSLRTLTTLPAPCSLPHSPRAYQYRIPPHVAPDLISLESICRS
ncbi:hypothetical protein L1887_53954 [Cichorium endivia]|nr:hypothetical protein L1887_53954 [Cichorium endivia]